MMITNNIKKEIINNWSNDFLDLSIYDQNKLYRVCGAFVFGIEILSLPRTNDYRPTFVWYPLWKPGIKHCLDEPIFVQEIYNKKGFQFNIPYTKDSTSFQEEAMECTKKQAPILSQQNVTLKQLFEVLNKQFSQTLIKSSPVGQAKLFEGKLLGALYVNNTNAIKQVLDELSDASKSWPPNLFEWKYGKLDTWLQSLHTIVTNRDEFLIQIKENQQDRKITKLRTSELIE